MENKWQQIKRQMSAMNKSAGVKGKEKCQAWNLVIFTEQRTEGAGKE